MRRALPSLVLLASLALFVGWTQDNQSDWLKGIIYAGSGKIQLTDATGNLVGGGSGAFAGNVAIGGTLAVTGATTLRSTLNVGGAIGVTGAAALQSTLKVVSDTNIGGALGVTGAAALQSTLKVVGAESVGGALSVTGATTLQSTLFVAGAESVGGALSVTGATTLAGTLSATTGTFSGAITATSLTLSSNETVAGTLAASGTFTPGGGIVGIATNTNAPTGIIGEWGQVSRVFSAATGITSATPKNIGNAAASITLTPGDWQITAYCSYAPAATTSVSSIGCAVSKTSATTPATDTLSVPTACEIETFYSTATQVPGSGVQMGISIPSYRCIVSSNTTIFLVGYAAFTVSTMTVYGSMEVRRMR